MNKPIDDLLRDVVFAARIFRRSPSFTLAALMSLVIGIGANTAIFSVTSALLLHPLPYKDADRLAILWNRSPGLGITEDWFSTAQYFDIRNGDSKTGSRVFEDVAIAIGGGENLTGDGEPERIGTIHVSSNLLPMLGVKPLHGRLLQTEDDAPGTPGVAILNYGTWMRRYGGDVSVLGKSLTLNGKPYQVVGVLPPSFALRREVMPTLGGAEDAEILLPLPLAPAAANIRDHEDYNILAKLRPGMSAKQAQAEMNVLTARLRHDYPSAYPPNGGLTFGVVPLLEQVVGDIRRPLWILSGAVVFVLLIACANVANLFLSHAVARHREMATRAALGAGRARLLRQLLTESLLLAVAGGLVGVIFAELSLLLIRAIGASRVPRLAEIAINGEVMLFTLLISMLAGIAFGLAPAVRIWHRRDLAGTLHEGDRGSRGGGNQLRRLLVVGELALSVVLLIGAGLLLRSFARLAQVPPGFTPRNLLTLELTMSGRKYANGPIVVQAYKQLCDRLEQLPGVSAAGITSALPLSEMYAWGPITVEGRPLPPGEVFINADERMVGGHYFQAMQIPLVRGRFFDEQDTPDKPRVAIIDEHMAQELWPGQDAVGKRIHTGGVDDKTPWITIVGIVGRVKQATLDSDPRIAFYLPHLQYPVRAMNVVVRGSTAESTLAGSVKAAAHDMDPDLPLYNVRTMQDRVNASLARQRFSMLLLTLFAGLAAILAALGTYGVTSYLVNQGTREIGIRVALGATPRKILAMILSRGLTTTLLGVTLGTIVAAGLSRLIESLLFEVRPTDPLIFASVVSALCLTTLLATYIPARRAARTDPLISLRCE